MFVTLLLLSGWFTFSSSHSSVLFEIGHTFGFNLGDGGSLHNESEAPLIIPSALPLVDEEYIEYGYVMVLADEP